MGISETPRASPRTVEAREEEHFQCTRQNGRVHGRRGTLDHPACPGRTAYPSRASPTGSMKARPLAHPRGGHEGPLSVQQRSVLVAGIVERAAGRDGSSYLSSRPDAGRLEGLPRSWRHTILDQQTAAATGVTHHRDAPVRQQHLALVPSDPFGSRIRVFDPGILGVIAHRSSSPRSFGHAYDRVGNGKGHPSPFLRSAETQAGPISNQTTPGGPVSKPQRFVRDETICRPRPAPASPGSRTRAFAMTVGCLTSILA